LAVDYHGSETYGFTMLLMPLGRATSNPYRHEDVIAARVTHCGPERLVILNQCGPETADHDG